MSAGLKLAYIVSRYPLVSHVFIQREVLALRRAGASVDTYTVRRPDAADLRTPEDREAYETTPALVPAPVVALAGAHLRALFTRPRRYFGTLRLALRMRAPGAKAALWQLFYFGEAALLWDWCRRSDARHVHAHHADVAADVALLATHLGGDAWSWSFTLHGPTELFAVAEHRLPQKAEMARLVVCITEYARSQVMGLVGSEHWDKLSVVHCSVELERFQLVDRRTREGGTLKLLTVGRAVPVKGQAVLIEAVAELVRRGFDVRLTVVGDGPELVGLRALAARLGVEGSVVFAGAVGQAEIVTYYERADVFALASFAEGLPVVLMEAMATGLPVVCTRIAGVPELVTDGQSGFLAAPGSVSELVAALERMVSEGAEGRAAMGRAGRVKVEAEYATDGVARQLLDAFREMPRVPSP